MSNTSNTTSADSSQATRLSTGAIAGISVGAIFGFSFLVSAVLQMFRRRLFYNKRDIPGVHIATDSEHRGDFATFSGAATTPDELPTMEEKRSPSPLDTLGNSSIDQDERRISLSELPAELPAELPGSLDEITRVPLANVTRQTISRNGEADESRNATIVSKSQQVVIPKAGPTSNTAAIPVVGESSGTIHSPSMSQSQSTLQSAIRDFALLARSDNDAGLPLQYQAAIGAGGLAAVVIAGVNAHSARITAQATQKSADAADRNARLAEQKWAHKLSQENGNSLVSGRASSDSDEPAAAPKHLQHQIPAPKVVAEPVEQTIKPEPKKMTARELKNVQRIYSALKMNSRPTVRAVPQSTANHQSATDVARIREKEGKLDGALQKLRSNYWQNGTNSSPKASSKGKGKVVDKEPIQTERHELEDLDFGHGLEQEQTLGAGQSYTTMEYPKQTIDDPVDSQMIIKEEDSKVVEVTSSTDAVQLTSKTLNMQHNSDSANSEAGNEQEHDKEHDKAVDSILPSDTAKSAPEMLDVQHKPDASTSFELKTQTVSQDESSNIERQSRSKTDDSKNKESEQHGFLLENARSDEMDATTSGKLGTDAG